MDHLRGPMDLEKRGATEIPAALYGDSIGGQSFSAEQAAALESAHRERRPITGAGWRKVWSNLTCYTVIDCRPETADDVLNRYTNLPGR